MEPPGPLRFQRPAFYNRRAARVSKKARSYTASEDRTLRASRREAGEKGLAAVLALLTKALCLPHHYHHYCFTVGYENSILP